MSNLNRL